MLNAVEVRGRAVASEATDRARVRVADALRTNLPGVAVTIEGEQIVLAGRITVDDPRLRWIASVLR